MIVLEQEIGPDEFVSSIVFALTDFVQLWIYVNKSSVLYLWKLIMVMIWLFKYLAGYCDIRNLDK
jgi:hypothetical protein